MNIELSYKKEQEDKQKACEALWEKYRPTIEKIVAESPSIEVDNKAIVSTIIKNGFMSFFRDHGDPDSHENKTNFDSFNFGDMGSILIRVAYMVTQEVGDLVGIQPVYEPKDKIHSLRYSFDEEGQMSLGMANRHARPRTRDLETGWTQACEYDLRSVSGLDIHAELCKAMSEVIAQQVFDEVLTDLLKLARNCTWQTHKPGDDWEADILFFDINRVSSETARETRRQAGNYIVCNKSVMDRLRKMKYFTELPADDVRRFKSMKLIGTANHINYYEADCVPDNVILVGAKAFKRGEEGKRLHEDTGYIFAPMALVGMRKLRPNEIQPMEQLPPQHFGNRQVTTQLTTSSDGIVEDRDWYRIIRL